MNTAAKNKKKHDRSEKSKTIFNMIPAYLICILIVLLPIAEARIDIKIHECEIPFMPTNDGIYSDVAARFREIFIFAVSILLVVHSLVEYIFFKRKISCTKKAVPIVLAAGYLIFVIVSSVCSEYPELGFWGISSVSEGIAANFGYIALFIAANRYIDDDRSQCMLCNAVSLSAALIFVEFIIEQTAGEISVILWNTASSNKATTLLFGNSAYCGEFCMLILPLAMCSAFKERNTALKIVKSFWAGMLVPITIGTYSSAAFYTCILCVLAFSLYVAFSGEFKKHRMLPFIIFFVTIAAALLINGDPEILINDALNGGAYSAEQSAGLTNAVLTGNKLLLETTDNAVTVEFANGVSTADIYDKNNGLLCELADGTQINFDEAYNNISLALSEGYLIIDLKYDEEIRFFYDGEKLYFVAANDVLVGELSKSAFSSFADFYSFGTGRGYIWLNSLPILQKCVFKGVGSGAFAFYFPQYDIVGMLNTHGNARVITDKPHSLYLGIAISYGIPALLVFGGLVFLTLKNGVTETFKNKNSAKAALLISIAAFLIMGAVNDSSPIYTPLFWIFAGSVCSDFRSEENPMSKRAEKMSANRSIKPGK